MLKKELRLSSPMPKSAKLVAAKYFNLKISQNGLLQNRFGFVFSKKIDKRAVVRNKAKRVLRSLIEEKVNEFTLGSDFLFIAKPDIVQATRQELEREIEQFLKEQKSK